MMIIMVLIISVFAKHGWACGVSPLSIEERIQLADLIFSGTVISEHKLKKPDDKASHFIKVLVKDVFKGKPGKTEKIYIKERVTHPYGQCRGDETDVGGYAGSSTSITFFVKSESEKLRTMSLWSVWPTNSGPGRKDLVELKKIKN